MVVPNNPDATMEQLSAQWAQARLYVAGIRRTEQWDREGPEFQELLRQHFIYLYGLQAEGVLFGAGPLEGGSPDDPVGMIIFAASSLEAATATAEREPFHAAGWRVNTVRTWTLNEGVAAQTGQLLHRLATRE
jgi:uncharacterized protein YciI